ncbi:PAS domain-containing protein [Pseudodonghicola flavimaris]|uniref:PAS-domain containing protein n=1 Tax=Pseudodonghicola flavimaris TaxID=3050036 RepID=A0ABT7EZR4_9RHOB|nr:PAS domain-containing protein [Pseudodonghicola flavimaris]MDK3017832.1 PAS-domain containing protein [Pseudodonghicola flavimaris]
MSDIPFTDLAALALIALASAALAIQWLSPRRSAAAPVPTLAELADAQASATPGGLNDDPVFLFDGQELIEASSSAQVLVGEAGDMLTWDRLRRQLLPDFPAFPVDPAQVRDAGRLTIPAIDGDPQGEALCEWIDGITRVHLRAGTPLSAGDLPLIAQELDILRSATNAAPYPAWRVDAKGQVTWCNTAYARLLRKVRGRDADTAQPLFPDLPQGLSEKRRLRQPIVLEDAVHKLWYDLWVIPQKRGSLCYAVDVNAVVDAEAAQRNFVQTLAKTFAQLSIGLAIFDRNRQLALFNPALIDLTDLPADFLSSRPSLLTFFDRLRDSAMMPEPKDYAGWRQRLADLVEAASNGPYQETWSLPSGSVYSVSGRPHPDGAVAFLIEDITAEITLTRRFRAELEQNQAVLDALPEAVAVFTPDGTLSFCNAAYRKLWGVDPDRSFAQYTVVDAARDWQDRSLPTPAWGQLRDFVSVGGARSPWQTEVPLRGGGRLGCQVQPIQNGATMVRFDRLAETGDKQPGHTRSSAES